MSSNIRMVDITGKERSYREAVAYGRIRLTHTSIEKISKGLVEKGDVITTAKLAGIINAKRTPEIIPLCHPIPITSIDVDIKIEDEEHIGVICTVKTIAQTGVEMEALTCVSASLLAIWDMVKKYEKDEKGEYPYTCIEDIRVVRKIKETRNAE